MMNVKVSDAASWVAEQMVEHKYAISKDVAQYNVVVGAFNVSTILLVTAVALTALMNFSAAVAIGAVGLFVRTVCEKEISQMIAIRATVGFLSALFRGNQNMIPNNWTENEVVVFDHVIWKNLI